MTDKAPQTLVRFTDLLTRHCQWGKHCPTNHSYIACISNHKEHFNLSITDALFLLVSDCVVVSPGNSFVCLGMQNCFTNLEPWKKCYVGNWFHSQNSNKVILIVCICRSAFSQCANCIEILFKMSSVFSTRKKITKYECVLQNHDDKSYTFLYKGFAIHVLLLKETLKRTRNKKNCYMDACCLNRLPYSSEQHSNSYIEFCSRLMKLNGDLPACLAT